MAPPAGFAIATAPAADDAMTPTTALLAAIASTASAAAATASEVGPESMKPNKGGECELLGSFALVVQAILGGLALLALVYKRWRERPQRPVKIWFFDVSKQVFGSVLVHIANVFMSMLTSGRFSVQVEPATVGNVPRWLAPRADDYTPNPCSFYLLNLAIDTTIGIPILIGLLKVFTLAARYTPFGKPYESIQSGHYGSPPNAWWWLKQSVIYFMGLFGMKLVVLLIFLVFPWISRVGDWALGWTEGNEQLQIFFVMMFFPLIMNALQYYVIDSFIKEADRDKNHERLPEDDPDWPAHGGNGARPAPSPYDEDEDLFSSDDENSGGRRGTIVKLNKNSARQEEREEYDPAFDGDAPTIVGSSSSRHQPGSNKLPQELYPKE